MNLHVLLALSLLFLATAARAAETQPDGVRQRMPHRQSSPPDAVPYRVPYRAITPSQADKTIVLTGRDLTIDEVVQSRGTVGEGDLWPLANVGAAMVGAGTAYLHGVRMPAARALEESDLAALVPFAAASCPFGSR